MHALSLPKVVVDPYTRKVGVTVSSGALRSQTSGLGRILQADIFIEICIRAGMKMIAVMTGMYYEGSTIIVSRLTYGCERCHVEIFIREQLRRVALDPPTSF